MGVLVTGASSGIGRSLALCFGSEGARVALVARRVEALEELAEEIRLRGGEALVLPCDVSDRAAALAAAADAARELGGVDILVNNAGYGHHRPFLRWDLDDMERVMSVNYLGSLYFTKALLPAMVERGRGWLVFVASVAGRIALPDETAYAASKFAMAGLAESLSIELDDSGVHVLTVFPGTVRTEFFDAEAIERMPAVAKRSMVSTQDTVDRIRRALARGQRELTYPRFIAAGYAVKGLAPAFLRWSVKRTTRA
jgi:short-subunit dehydrogenase